MNKKNRIFVKMFCATLMICLLCLNLTTVQAVTLSEMEDEADAFIEAGKAAADGIEWGNVVTEFVSLGQILTMIGIGVMVAVVTYMGIKYLTAGPEAQAKLKAQLIGILVSGMVIFGSYSIWKLVIQVAENF